MEEVGVIYVAFGAPYLAMALTSIVSLRVFNPSTPVCVVTNVCREPPSVHWWSDVPGCNWTFIDEVTSMNRDIKTRVYAYSPFRKSLYLDCDTLVLSDISQLSFFLDHFDVLLRGVSRPDSNDANRMLFDGAMRFDKLTNFNSGVIAFRKCSNVERFFECWRTRYSALGFKRDQPSLVEALYYSDVRLLPLLEKWNMGDKWKRSKRARNSVLIWHYKVRMDKYLERCLLRAVGWFSDDPKDLDDVKVFIQKRRRSRGYGRSPSWLLTALITGMQGSLSKLPEKHAGRENWKKFAC